MENNWLFKRKMWMLEPNVLLIVMKSLEFGWINWMGLTVCAGFSNYESKQWW